VIGGGRGVSGMGVELDKKYGVNGNETVIARDTVCGHLGRRSGLHCETW
jgi:hypothetical protein